MSSDLHPQSAAWAALSLPTSPTCAFTQTIRVWAPPSVRAWSLLRMTERMSQCFSASTEGAKSPSLHCSTIYSSVMQSVKMASNWSVSARTSTSAAPPISPRVTTRSPLTWSSKLSPGSSLTAPAPTKRAFFSSSVSRSCLLPSVHASNSARPTFGLDG
eukprot:952460-Rhodomonas_salina.1